MWYLRQCNLCPSCMCSCDVICQFFYGTAVNVTLLSCTLVDYLAVHIKRISFSRSVRTGLLLKKQSILTMCVTKVARDRNWCCRICPCSMTRFTITSYMAGWVHLKRTYSRLRSKLLCMTKSWPCLMGKSTALSVPPTTVERRLSYQKSSVQSMLSLLLLLSLPSSSGYLLCKAHV